MNQQRYELCYLWPDFYPLTDDEVAEGWHFCPEFGGLLIGPDTKQWDFCECFPLFQLEKLL